MVAVISAWQYYQLKNSNSTGQENSEVKVKSEVEILLGSDKNCQMREDPSVAQEIGRLLEIPDYAAIFALRPQRNPEAPFDDIRADLLRALVDGYIDIQTFTDLSTLEAVMLDFDVKFVPYGQENTTLTWKRKNLSAANNLAPNDLLVAKCTPKKDHAENSLFFRVPTSHSFYRFETSSDNINIYSMKLSLANAKQIVSMEYDREPSEYDIPKERLLEQFNYSTIPWYGPATLDDMNMVQHHGSRLLGFQPPGDCRAYAYGPHGATEITPSYEILHDYYHYSIAANLNNFFRQDKAFLLNKMYSVIDPSNQQITKKLLSMEDEDRVELLSEGKLTQQQVWGKFLSEPSSLTESMLTSASIALLCYAHYDSLNAKKDYASFEEFSSNIPAFNCIVEDGFIDFLDSWVKKNGLAANAKAYLASENLSPNPVLIAATLWIIRKNLPAEYIDYFTQQLLQSKDSLQPIVKITDMWNKSTEQSIIEEDMKSPKLHVLGVEFEFDKTITHPIAALKSKLDIISAPQIQENKLNKFKESCTNKLKSEMTRIEDKSKVNFREVGTTDYILKRVENFAHKERRAERTTAINTALTSINEAKSFNDAITALEKLQSQPHGSSKIPTATAELIGIAKNEQTQIEQLLTESVTAFKY